jgi:hypothetical protein
VLLLLLLLLLQGWRQYAGMKRHSVKLWAAGE